MMHREQLGRDEPPQLRAAFDVVSFGDAALHRFAPKGARVLLEAADQPRQFASLRLRAR